MDLTELEIELQTRRKYSGAGGVYDPETISHLPNNLSADFSNNLLRFKLDRVMSLATHRKVLDVGCGNGAHALEISRISRLCIGIDFSLPFIEYAAHQAKESKQNNIYFCCGNARELPFSSNYFDVAFSFAALYYVSRPTDVITEISRVIKADGIAILELGNSRSLNTLVCKQYPELAQAMHIPEQEMLRAIELAGLKIIEHYRFQLLPMWADRPWWLKPLLKPSLNRLLSRKFRGKMIDEWLCRIPLLKGFAHRHIFICKK